MNKHPAPWRLESEFSDECGIDYVLSANGKTITRFTVDHEDEPSARLMAASPDLLDAAQSAVHVLFLLEREVNALGFRAGNVREKLSAAIRKAGADDGRWNERLAEARGDLADAIAEREQPE